MIGFFERLVDPYVAYPETDAPPRRLWPWLVDVSRPFHRVFAATGTMAMLVAAVELSLIWYMGRIVDLLGSAPPAEVWRAHGTEFLAAGLFVLLVRPLLAAVNTMLLHNAILPNFGTLVRWRAHRHVLRQSIGWFENDFAGRIANRITQTPRSAGEAVFHVFDAVAFSLTMLVGAAVVLAGVDLRLVVPLLVWFALYMTLVRWTLGRAGPASKAASDGRSAVLGRVVDAYTNIHSVKLFARQDQEIEGARSVMDVARETSMAEMRVLSRMDIMLTVLNGGLIVSVTALALGLWFQGLVSVGMVAATTALVLRLNNMTYWIMWATTTLVQALGTVAEGLETITEPLKLVDRPGAQPLRLTRGRIEFQDLRHHYGRGSGGLDRVTLTVEPGERIGLVGRSGAGKSTLVKLLLRFYDPEGGRILIDGQDVTAVTQDSLREAIGMVQQESSLLHRSVRENILYSRPDATQAQLDEAVRRAAADGFIATLADAEGRTGYDARVGERGVKLSGGQRQRIALARVILKDAPILVLDEATSALDSEVEAAIQDTLYGLMQGKTVIAIAHRLSTIAQLDRIVVLDEGRIVEEGTHASLLAEGGLYARLWARQSGGFLGLDAEAEPGRDAAE